MQRFFLNLILALSCLFLLIFIVTEYPHQKSKTVIKYSSWGSESELAIIKPLLKEFENQNPKIKVEFMHIPQNYFQKLHLLVASNLTPDVIFINNINGVFYAENKILLNLANYLNQATSISQKDFFPKALSSFNHKESLYAIPRDISNLVVYYNKDIFDKYNIAYPSDNWTMQEFLETAQQLTKALNKGETKTTKFGVSFREMPLFWLPYLWSNSGGVLSQDKSSIIIDTPESINSIQFYSDLRNKHHVAPTKSEAGSSTMAQLFLQEKLAMHISGRWCVPKYRKEIKFNWDIARFPAGKNGSVVDCDSSGWAISAKSKHPQQAWKLIEFLASKNSITQFTKNGLIIPARIDVANSEVFLDKNLPPSNSEIFINIIEDSIPTPATSNYQEILDSLNSALEPVWNGRKQAKEVINKDLVEKLQNQL